jgi:hypothetical protein
LVLHWLPSCSRASSRRQRGVFDGVHLRRSGLGDVSSTRSSTAGVHLRSIAGRRTSRDSCDRFASGRRVPASDIGLGTIAVSSAFSLVTEETGPQRAPPPHPSRGCGGEVWWSGAVCAPDQGVLCWVCEADGSPNARRDQKAARSYFGEPSGNIYSEWAGNHHSE